MLVCCQEASVACSSAFGALREKTSRGKTAGMYRPTESGPATPGNVPSRTPARGRSCGRVRCRRARRHRRSDSACAEHEKFRQTRVLPVGVGLVVGAFELHADGEVVTALASPRAGRARVPGSLRARHQLDQFAPAPYEKMR